MKTIFVVDDNDTNLIMAEAALENQYRVITLPSAARMFEIIEKIKPDLILMDIKMPVMNGYDAFKQLKTIKEYANIPVIFSSALSDAKGEAQGKELGAADFICKPFSEAALLSRVKHHLRHD